MYPRLLEDKHWDSFKSSMLAVARVHGVEDVLDPFYKPTMFKKDLFDEMSKFVYAILLQNVKTPQGTAIVKEQLASANAQTVWAELVLFYSSSPAAKLRGDELMGFQPTNRGL